MNAFLDAAREGESLIRDAARGFVAARHSMQRVRQMRTTETGYSRGVWAALAEAGWLGLRVPESQGGAGLGIAEAALLCEVFGEALLPEPFIACGLIPPLLVAGSPPSLLRDRLLPGVMSGSSILTLAWQEAPLHFEADRCKTVLSATAGELRLNGTKRFVASGVGSDGYLVTCLRGGQFALAHVPGGGAGLSVRGQRQLDGSVCADIDFRDVALTADGVLAEGEKAQALVSATVAEATLAVCATLTAVARRALTMSVDYMGKRVQFGKPIGSFQALQHRAVDLAVRCALAEAAMRRAVEELAAGSARAAADVSAAKAICSRTATLVTRTAIQLHGGIGYTDEADIGLYLKSALRFAAYLGIAQAHRARFMVLKQSTEQ